MNRAARLHRRSSAELREMLSYEGDPDLRAAIYDELDARDQDDALRDWTEQDARAASEERLENLRGES